VTTKVKKTAVATGGHPAAAVMRAVQTWGVKGGVYDVAVAHDEGCVCLADAPLTACTCEIIEITGKKLLP
jgi:hypothetical protein